MSEKKTKPRIMVADDDPFIVELYRAKLTREGFEVAGVSDGEEAIAKLRAWHPDLLLLDMSMPRMGGLEVLQFVRSDSKLKDTPVIVLSNTSSDSVMTEIWDMKPARYLTKRDSKPKKVMEEILEVFRELPDASHGDDEPSGIRASSQSRNIPFDFDSAKDALSTFVSAADGRDRSDAMLDAYKNIQAPLNKMKDVDPRTTVYQYANAFDNLYETLYTKPEYINASTYATLRQATEILPRVLQLLDERELSVQTDARVLLASDDEDLRESICRFIDRPGYSIVATRDPQIAISLMDDNRFGICFFHAHRKGAYDKLRKRIDSYPARCPSRTVFLLESVQVEKLGLKFGGENLDCAMLPANGSELILKACTFNVSRMF